MAEDISKAYEKVEKQVKEELANSQKSLKFSLKVKGIALIVVIIYLAIVTSMISQFNATSAMEALLGSLKNNDEMKTKLVNDLNSSADANVDQLYTQLNASIPQVRTDLEKVVDDKINVFAGTVETEFNASLEDYIKAKIDEINITSKDADPEAKLNSLLASLRNDFKTITFAFTTELTGQLSEDLMELNKQLKKLQANKNLSLKEKQQRNLIAIWVKLLDIKLKESKEIL